MTRIREDPSLKPILEEIESGGPAAMMRLVIIISSIVLLLAYKNGEKLEDCCYVSPALILAKMDR